MAWANRHGFLPVVQGTFYGAYLGQEKGGANGPSPIGDQAYNFF
jgi:hypothetical protein